MALARSEGIATGTVLASGTPPKLPMAAAAGAGLGLAIAAEKRADDVKLTGAIARVIEEDPTLSLEHNADLQEMVLWGQGDIHLQIALDRLRTKYNLAVTAQAAAGALQRDHQTGDGAAFALQAPDAAATASSPTSRSR